MRRARRILLIAGVTLLSVSAVEARLWGSKKARTPAPETAALPASIALTAVDVDGSRIVLRTSGAPAYTSYSPSPGVFVVDLTNTSRDRAVSIPASLPPAVTSISADDVVEMGSTLTRVTFRLSETLSPEVSAAEKSVVVTIPAIAIAIESTVDAVSVLPAVTPVAQPEPVVATAGTLVEEPHPVVEETLAEAPALPRARSLRNIAADTANGAVEVRITGDGALKYKAFRLESPSRLVIDLDGVKNATAKNNITVAGGVVKGVRVAQFQPTVARVVIDLAQKTEYTIAEQGDQLRVAFGGAVPQMAKVTPPPAPAPKKIAPPPAPAPAPIAVVADAKPTWKVPEPASKGARKVINASAEQTAPVQPATREDVFSEAQVSQPQVASPAAQTLLSTRTLSAGPRTFNGEPISLNLKDADLKDVLRTFAELTGLNIAVDPGVRGTVTVDFVDVPWDQALDIILRQNSLTFMLEGNVMRIGTISRIAEETAASRRLAEEERLNVPLTTVSFPISYARASEIAGMLRDLASPRARILVDARTNQLIISEIPAYLTTMQNLIRTVDVPTRQVMIEARIVESSRTFSQLWGVEWGFSGDLDPALGTGTGLVFPNRIGFDGGPFKFAQGNPVLGFHFFDVLGAFNLDFVLSAAENQGFIKVISAPRVTTQDNTPANIQSGFQIPYQTRVNFTTTITYLNAILQLAVTPQITDAGTVIMDIQVQKTEPAEGLAIVGAAGTPLTTRQASTKLMVRDGGTAVIAGIFQTRDNRAESRVPFVHNIPVIGNLFKSHNVTSSHDELLIFITPRIVRGM